MRLQSVLLLLLLVPIVHAGVAYKVIDTSPFLTDYAAGSGTCTYDMKTPDLTATWSATGVWPASGTNCPDKEYAYIAAGRKILLTQGRDFIADQRVELYATAHTSTDAFLTKGVAKAEYNKITELETTPVLQFAWCGDKVHAKYTKTTITPSELTLEGETDNQCGAFYTKYVGSLYSGAGGFVSTEDGLAKPLTLPLQAKCSSYDIQFIDRTHNDWPDKATIPLTKNGNTHTYTLAGSNTLTVTVTDDAQGRLASITVDSFDGSGGNGGVAFNILCALPTIVDGDTSQTACSPFAWSSAVHTAKPGFGCCGDDGVADETGAEIAGYICEKPAGTYKWTATSTMCGVGNTYLSGAGCCTAANKEKVFTSETEQAVCIAQTTGTTTTHVWKKASTEQLLTITRSATDIVKLASDGTRWYACVKDANLAPIVSTESITTAAVCKVVKNTKLPTTAAAKEYRCIGPNDWRENTGAFVLDRNGNFVGDATKPEATHTCVGETLSDGSGNRKYSPDYKKASFCPTSQCYTGDTCVDANAWHYEYVCSTKNSVGTWSTRTQFLADTLVNNAPSDYILHCDSPEKTLNEYAQVNAYTSAPTYVNAFCALSERASRWSSGSATKQRIIALGVTLNANTAAAPSTGTTVIEYPIPPPDMPKPFVELLNTADVDMLTNTCTGTAMSNGYIACPMNSSKGKVWFHPQQGVLIFTWRTDLFGRTQFTIADRNPAGTLSTQWQSITGTPNPLPSEQLLAGDRIYAAKTGTRIVQGTWQQSLQGPYTLVAYSNVNPPPNVATTQFGTSKVFKGTADQAEWTRTTVAVRPK